MAVTIKDIANKLNLSKSTVSYALNGGPKPVSDDVRERVCRTAQELGFRPNQIARSLAIGRTNTVCFVPHSMLPGEIASPFARTALAAIYAAAHDHGVHVMLPSGYDPHDPSTRERLFDAHFDRVLLLSSEDEVLIRDVRERGVPLALVASNVAEAGPTFTADNFSGARALADHLCGLGHRRLGILGKRLPSDVRFRCEAFRLFCEKHGAEVCPLHYVKGSLTVEGGYEAGRVLLETNPRPTAVFCANDRMAYGLMLAARELGISVPEELSVVGFDDDEVSALLWPSLTTVRQPVEDMARAGFEAVLRQIAGEPVSGTVFATELIERHSTSRPKEDSL